MKAKLDVAKKTQKAIWEKLQPAVDTYNKLKEELDKSKLEREDLGEKAKVDEKEIELLHESIQGTKQKRDAIVNKYYADEDGYFTQQKLIRKIEWLTREKERAVRDAEYRREREEEERSRVPVHPYSEEMEICGQLMAYCKRYMTAKKEEEKKEAPKTENAALSAKISKGELKPMESKKKKEEELFIIGGKKKKDKKDKKAKKAEEEKINVDFGTLALFDRVHLQPPLYPKDAQATFEKLVIQKKYFDELPAKEEKKAPVEKKVEAPAAAATPIATEVKPAAEVAPVAPVVPVVAKPEETKVEVAPPTQVPTTESK